MLGAPLVHHAYEVAYDAQCKVHLSQLHRVLRMDEQACLPGARQWTSVVRAAGCAELLVCPKGSGEASDGEGVSVAGNVVQIDPPASCVFNDLESNTLIRLFAERESFRLPTSVAVDITAPGYYERDYDRSAGTIPAGTVVDSYFLFFDPVGSGPAESSGAITMGGDVLGFIVLTDSHDRVDAVLGAPGTRYPTGQRSRGFESGAERVTFEEDRLTFTINRFHSTFPGENVRILTVPGGGPASYGMNDLVPPAGGPARQVLLLDYTRTIVEPMGQDGDEGFRELLPMRHFGRSNVLFVDGHVEDLAPEELVPSENARLWEP
jgi:prepilin-type processing-associated H-X9-DG protein